MVNKKVGETIYEACRRIDNEIKSDFGGGCPIEKSFLMAYLVQNQKLKTYVEIGVYRGKSFFPTAYSIHLNNGKSYGIDPYTRSNAIEFDTPENIKNDVNTFLERVDFDDIYKNTEIYRKNCEYSEDLKLIRKSSQDAISYFKKNNIKIDFLHIDGNHDAKHIRQDFELYNEILNEGGFIVFDDIDWESVDVVYREAKKELTVVFECECFGILYKEKNGFKDFVKTEKLNKRLVSIYNKIKNKENNDNDSIPLITVGVLAYNCEEYIVECLDHIVKQKGGFRCKVIILDDKSTDNTEKNIKNYLKGIKQTERMRIQYVRNKENIGMVENYAKLIKLISKSGCDYFTMCDGDDYYLASDRLETHLLLHKRFPELAMSFNKLLLYWQQENRYEVYDADYNVNIVTTEDIVTDNRPGSLCASFYDAKLLGHISDSLFKDMYTGDWMFNIFYSQFGDVRLINLPMSVYRKHFDGIWSGNKPVINNKILVSNIKEYNKYLSFLYDNEFQIIRNEYIEYLISKNAVRPYEIAIIDNIFPNPLSGFSYQEFTNILDFYKNSVVCTTGAFSCLLSNEPVENMIVKYKRDYPAFSDRVLKIDEDFSFSANLLYGIFLNTAYNNLLPLSEKMQVPFVFTLYPGGGFCLNDRKSDKKLKAVFTSPWFKKVIVTQQATYDYLIKKHFCKKKDIEFIFGVVTDTKKIGQNIKNKKRFGINKDTLDICFVAHKYTKNGRDKGYDLFIEVAKKLSKKYDNIVFHIVGPWDKNVIDTKGVKNIIFYGSKPADWFEEFYKDKDIIVSPNINGILAKGAFDGFPTTSVTDASLCGVAMFITDPLKMNRGRFIEGEEIVTIKHSADDIVKKVEYYYYKPEKLKNIGEMGKLKSEKLYSHENQIIPRLKVLKNVDLSLSKRAKKKINKQKYKKVGRDVLKEITPNIAKRAYRKARRIIK